MELEEVIAQRRSIRKFETKPVDKVKREKLIEAARLCQSAKNRQPWQFMILKDGRKDQVAGIMLQLFESHDEELPGYVNSSRHTAQIIQNAPVLMLVFREPDELWIPGDLLSIGAAIEHVCLEAVNLGLGALWIRDTRIYVKGNLRLCRLSSAAVSLRHCAGLPGRTARSAPAENSRSASASISGTLTRPFSFSHPDRV